MPLSRFVLMEIRHRPVGALLGATAVAVATAMVFFLWGVAQAGERETRIIQRDIGLNLVIVPEETTPYVFARGGIIGSMPEEYIDRVAEQDVANRLIPMARGTRIIGDVKIEVVGIAPERFKRNARMKPVFGMDIARGRCVIGGGVAETLGLATGETVPFGNDTFTIERTLATSGSEDDARIYLALQDAQKVLGMEGKLTEIRALECHCSAEVEDPAEWLREQLGPLLPGTRVLRMSALAEARRQQRLLAERYLTIAGPVILVLAAVVVCLLAIMNVRERRNEIGVLRAIGWTSGRIGSAILARAALIGLFGALPGVVLGVAMVELLGPSLFTTSFIGMQTDFLMLASALLLAPLFATIAALVPAALAINEDPAEILRES